MLTRSVTKWQPRFMAGMRISCWLYFMLQDPGPELLVAEQVADAARAGSTRAQTASRDSKIILQAGNMSKLGN